MSGSADRGTGWRWPLWLLVSVLLLGIPALIWSTRAWWPGFAAILGRIDPAFCDLPPDIARAESEAEAAHAEEAALRRELATIQEQVLANRARLYYIGVQFAGLAAFPVVLALSGLLRRHAGPAPDSSPACSVRSAICGVPASCLSKRWQRRSSTSAPTITTSRSIAPCWGWCSGILANRREHASCWSKRWPRS